jgi:hypothetical protein
MRKSARPPNLRGEYRRPRTPWASGTSSPWRLLCSQMAGSTGFFKEQVLAPLVLVNPFRVNPTCTIREIYDWRSGATGYSQVLIDEGDLLKYFLRPDTRFGGRFREARILLLSERWILRRAKAASGRQGRRRRRLVEHA